MRQKLGNAKTIKNDQGVTGKMTVGAKGNIKVSRTISKKVEYDE